MDVVGVHPHTLDTTRSSFPSNSVPSYQSYCPVAPHAYLYHAPCFLTSCDFNLLIHNKPYNPPLPALLLWYLAPFRFALKVYSLPSSPSQTHPDMLLLASHVSILSYIFHQQMIFYLIILYYIYIFLYPLVILSLPISPLPLTFPSISQSPQGLQVTRNILPASSISYFCCSP